VDPPDLAGVEHRYEQVGDLRIHYAEAGAGEPLILQHGWPQHWWMWRELIDKEDAWPESSSSAMFSFAMITGVKHGWLDAKTYGAAARKAWIAVVGYVDQNSDVTQVCEGTGKKDDLAYYYQRKRRTGDFHGQAPVLWSASALLRDEK